MANSNTSADAVIDGIYASVLEAESVCEMQRLLCATLDAPASTMMRIDDGLVPISWLGFDPGTTESYSRYYHQTDLWIAAGKTLPMGFAANVERLVPRASYVGSEFYADFMRQHGDATQLMGLMFQADEASYSLTFMRVNGQPDFDDAAESRFSRWSPHLRRAFTTRQRLDRQTCDRNAADLLTADTDALHMLVTGDLRIRWMSRNDPAATPGLVLRRTSDGPMRLEAVASHTQDDLVRAVQEATRRQPPLSGAVRLTDDFILVDPCAWTGGTERLALLHLPDRPAVEAHAIARATGLFHLTSAEAMVCRRLMHGDTIEMHAAAMGLSPWTVRTHLRNVFAKTGTSRQAELVALLYRMAR